MNPVVKILKKCIVAVQGGDEWRKEMKQAFNELVLLVRDEHTVSAYELGTSGLVQALYSTLSVSAGQLVCFLFIISRHNLTEFH